MHKGGGAPAEARVGGVAAEAVGVVCGGQGGVPARGPEAAEELHHALLELQETRELNEVRQYHMLPGQALQCALAGYQL